MDGAGSSVVPNAGSTLLLRTAQTVGLTGALSAALTAWREPLARHDPHTPTPNSGPRGTSTPTSAMINKITKDPG